MSHIGDVVATYLIHLFFLKREKVSEKKNICVVNRNPILGNVTVILWNFYNITISV